MPFSFTHEFAPGLTAFGTRNVNDAGKTSLLEVVIWSLRGRCNLQGDVRQWINQASVEVTLAGDRILIGWTVTNGRPRGRVLLLNDTHRIDWPDVDKGALAHFRALADDRDSRRAEYQGSQTGIRSDHETIGWTPLSHLLITLVTSGAVELAEFEGDTDFEAVMSALMLERLSFQRLPQWQRAPAAARVDNTDGSLSEHGWAAWSQALVITNPAIKVPLGEELYVAARLLQVYLGTAWAAPAAVAAARKSQLENRLGVLRRRAADVSAARTNSLQALQVEARGLSAKLALMPEPDAVAEAERLMTEIAEAAEEYAGAQEAYAAAAAAYGATARLLESAEADEYALGQAAVTRRFWHSLQPSCCPRCDTAVDESQWRRESEGHCSLCGSDVDLTGEDKGAAGLPEPLSSQEADRLVRRGADVDLDELDDLSAVRLQVAQLRARVADEDGEMDVARAARDAGRIRLEAARQAGQAIDTEAARTRRDVEIALARVEGQISERSQGGADGPDASILRETQQALTVVTTAELLARRRRDSDQAQMLADVSAQVTDLGRRLGVAQLERATLRGNMHMPVVKGGQRHNFGNLTEGEVLRLKIALVIALLRVGTSAGVGRHPGLLLIDSLGREELNPDDLITMLQELQQIARDTPLQIVATSAYGDILERALPENSLRLSGAGERLW